MSVIRDFFAHPGAYERREGMHHDATVGIVGITTWLFFGISIITVFIFLLGSINDDFEFRSTAIFLFIMVGTFVLINIYLNLARAEHHKENIREEENDLVFFMNDIDMLKLAWVPFCFILILLTSSLLSSWTYIYAPHITLMLAGLILFIGFERTGAVLVPILAHGFYNSIIVYLQFKSNGLNILLSSAIKVARDRSFCIKFQQDRNRDDISGSVSSSSRRKCSRYFS